MSKNIIGGVPKSISVGFHDVEQAARDQITSKLRALELPFSFIFPLTEEEDSALIVSNFDLAFFTRQPNTSNSQYGQISNKIKGFSSRDIDCNSEHGNSGNEWLFHLWWCRKCAG